VDTCSGPANVTVTAVAISPTEGTVFSGAVANASISPFGNVGAIITWGDGATSGGTLSGSGGNYVVSGSHTYAEDGTYAVTVTVTDVVTCTQGTTAPTTVTATGSGAGLAQVAELGVAAVGMTLAATEGTSFAGAVATFSDPGSPDPGSAYSASIDWGDKTTTPATVTGSSGSYTVTGTHTYAEDGSYAPTVTVWETGIANSTASANDAASVAEGTVSAAGLTATAAEGATATATVATYNDPGSPDPCGAFSASIDWGDKTSATPGTVVGGPGSYSVTGNHLYAEDGTYTATVTVWENGVANSTATATVTVTETDLGATGLVLGGTEASALGGTLATVTDPGSPDPGSAYSATINWGDSTAATPGNVTGSSGSYAVSGSHVYAEEGTYTATVSVSEAGVGGATAAASATVNVSEAVLSPTGLSLAATEGSALSTAVATFTDPGSPDGGGNFTATIDWGDHTGTTPGNVTGSGGSYAVSGSHTYAEDGTYAVTVTISETGVALTVTAFSTAAIGEAAVSAGGLDQAATESLALSGAVATYSDPGSPDPGSAYTASIKWGDGTAATPGTVNGSGGSYTVSGSHTYAEDGTYQATVTVWEIGFANSTATATDVVSVSEGIVSAAGMALSPTEGTSFAGAVATYSDPGSPDPSSAYRATIDWGDQTTTPGTVTGSGGSYTVSGTHTYAEDGSYQATITVWETGYANSTASATDAVLVAEATVSAAGLSVAATEGSALAGTVATFTDPGSPDPGTSFSASINWGDSTAATPGNVSGSGGSYSVSGSHTYAEDGTYNPVVMVWEIGIPNSTASATSTAVISEATVSAAGMTLNPTESLALSGAVATYSDPGSPDLGPAFSASINWGDGTSATPGKVTGSSGSYTVTGTHTYAEDGTYQATITAWESGFANSTATANDAVTVAEATISVSVASPLVITEGSALSTQVAGFTDPGSPDPSGSFTATIDWGDGTSGAGTVTGSSGSYVVSGSHTYADDGNYPLTVTVTEKSVVNGTATATGTVVVAEATLIVTPASLPTLTEGQALNTQVATFTDPGSPDPSGSFTATINWGDGTAATPGNVTGSSGSYAVTGAHTYADEGTYAVTVTVAEPGVLNGTAGASSTVTVLDAALVPGNFVPVTAPVLTTEGASFTGRVLSFTDQDPLTNYTATIDWGDGTQTTGIMGGGSGSWTVSGSHSYAEKGPYPLTVLVAATRSGIVIDTPVYETALVSDAPASAAAQTLVTTQCTTLTGVTVATFTDANPGDAADPTTGLSDYTALIDWGDGTPPEEGLVTGAAGSYQVLGLAHAYPFPGSFVVHTRVLDEGRDPLDAYGAATVAPQAAAGAVAVTVGPLAVTEGLTVSNAVVATFTDTNPTLTAAAFSATIDWGDGSQTPGTVLGGSGTFAVLAGHLYAEHGSFLLGVNVTGPNGSANGYATALVADRPLAASGLSLTVGVEPLPATTRLLLASFTDPNLGTPAAGYQAWINWGDETGFGAGEVAGSGGAFWVAGYHNYANPGAYTATVLIADQRDGGDLGGTWVAVTTPVTAAAAAEGTRPGTAARSTGSATATPTSRTCPTT
jgi:hypothetical protein